MNARFLFHGRGVLKISERTLFQYPSNAFWLVFDKYKRHLYPFQLDIYLSFGESRWDR